MNLQDKKPSVPLLPPPKPRFPISIIQPVRAWLRTRSGRIVLPLSTLLIGLLCGFFTLLLIALIGDGQLRAVPHTAVVGNIVAEADKTYVTHIVQQNLQSSGMPGTIKNIQVTLVYGDQMTIDADDEFSLLGLEVTRHFTLVMQLYVSACFLQLHIVHADVSSIPITGFVDSFEVSINQQLQTPPSGLPKGFTYCTVGVRTEPGGVFVTYSATPV